MTQVDKETYLEAFKKQKLKPIASFSDPDGVLPFGYGVPAMDTEWGAEESGELVARCEMRKESRHETEWEYRYYIKNLE